MDVVVGGGPAGCYTAELLAKKGRIVTLIEEHPKIGLPIQCTGIVTRSLFDMIRPHKSFMVNRLKRVRIHAPDRNTAEVKTDDAVICRSAFDMHLAERAEKAGAQIRTSTRVEAIKRKDGSRSLSMTSKGKSIKTLDAETLIGADGPSSIVSKHIGNKRPEFWTGMQARVKMPVDKDTYEVHFGDTFPGFFGWVVPEDDCTARVGVASRKNPNKSFEHLLQTIGKHKLIEKQGGIIPIHSPMMRLHHDGIFLVGDAATQVKATTGGGIVPGLRAAEGLARSIASGTSYRREILKVNRELLASLMIRSVLDRFKEEDYNRLIGIISTEKMKRILDEEDRDSPTRILFKTAINKPQMMTFSRVLLRAKRL